jgi:tetratricopeptide (TPR) repeat protein
MQEQTTVRSSPANIGSTSTTKSLADALAFYRRGDFDQALKKYQQILLDDPKSPDAHAGLIRTYLKMKDVEQASQAATKALEVADTPPVRVALGEVYFRQGRITDAQTEFRNVLKSGQPDARAYLGLARVYWSASLNKSGWILIEKAYDLDPVDPDIRRAWMLKLNTKDRIKYLEEYLAGENNDDEETLAGMRHYLEFLEARTKDPRGACRLVSKFTTTETPLVRLLEDPVHLRGYGLTVEVNGRKTKLMLDTGAPGIVINRTLAEKAHVTRLADIDVGGVGDKGEKSAYRALADSLKVGGLEFQNCTVEVLEKRSVVGEDGLIGGDVFSSFLVDIDFPNEKLRLKDLPRRPDNKAASPLKLHSEEGDDGERDVPGHEAILSLPATDAQPRYEGMQDRYIAPEMQSYTRVFRFGHLLLVPTTIGDVPGKLFLLDSGAFSNHITPAAAREVTKVRNSDAIVHGLSGSVNKVYSADKAVLQFGHLKQENQDLLTFDLTHISDRIGTEISGTLGFGVLRMLEVKIDYRDGLVDFDYDPKRWGE